MHQYICFNKLNNIPCSDDPGFVCTANLEDLMMSIWTKNGMRVFVISCTIQKGNKNFQKNGRAGSICFGCWLAAAKIGSFKNRWKQLWLHYITVQHYAIHFRLCNLTEIMLYFHQNFLFQKISRFARKMVFYYNYQFEGSQEDEPAR